MLSRRTFNEQKRYETVLFQENTHPGDFEVVELQDIQNREREAAVAAIITDGFLLNGFKAVGASLDNAVYISLGTGYSQGRRLLVPDVLHQQVSGQVLFSFAIPTPTVNRTDLIYIDIFIETIDQSTDPVIEDPSLGPSATRERVRYNFMISQGVSNATVPTLPVGHFGLPIALVTRRANDPAVNLADCADARPLSGLNPQFKPQNTLIVSPEGGDFQDPAAAVASITTSSASNPWTVFVMPGVYTTTTPILFSFPYISMVGTDPESCRILYGGVGLSTVRINADHISLRNLTLDFVSGSGTHSAAVFSLGAFTTTLNNLRLNPGAWAGGDTDGFTGIYATAGGTWTVRDCLIYGQLGGTGSPCIVVNGGATMAMDNCQVFAGTENVLLNGGTMTIRDCAFTGTMAMIVSSGPMTTYDTTWQTLPLKSYTVGGTEMVTLTTAVSNIMRDCTIDAVTIVGTSTGHITGNSIDWSRVRANLQLFHSGGGTSKYIGCEFQDGIDVNGSTVDFRNCVFYPTVGTWPSGDGNPTALNIRGGAVVLVEQCKTAPITNFGIYVNGASPRFLGCHFTSNTDAGQVMQIGNGALPILDACLIEALVAYTPGPGSGLLVIGDTTSTLTLVHCHGQGDTGGQPSFLVYGFSVGSKLIKGRNTGSVGTLYDSTTVTVVTSDELN